MSYVMVQNKGEVPIWGIRLMGLSNKDEKQIGKFGTGLKESIALLARLGKLPTIFSGTLRIDFSVQQVSGQDEICFRLSHSRDQFESGKWHGLGLHPNLGKADWNHPWMVFREIVCNALDASGIDDLYHDVWSRELLGVEGATRIFIPLAPELLEAYATVTDKLLPLGEYTVENHVTVLGEVIGKRKQKGLQVFHKGVWVQDAPEPSLYDYNIDLLKLNESRKADWYDVNSRMAHMIAYFTPVQIGKLLTTMLRKGEGEPPYEAKVLGSVCYYLDEGNSDNWRQAWHDVFGENAVVTESDKFFYDRLNQVGKRPIIVEYSGLRELLKKAGIPYAADVLTQEQQEYEAVLPVGGEAQERFDAVWDLLASRDLTQGKDKPQLMMFKQRAGQAVAVHGKYRNQVCYVNQDIVGSVEERRTYVEEILHHVTGATDYSMEFQNYMLLCLDHFMHEGETS